MKDKANFLRILGDETKLKLIQLLLGGELCVCVLYPALERAQSTISKHLNDLERIGILKSRREGKSVYYSISDKRVLALCRLLDIKPKKISKMTC